MPAVLESDNKEDVIISIQWAGSFVRMKDLPRVFGKMLIQRQIAIDDFYIGPGATQRTAHQITDHFHFTLIQIDVVLNLYK